MEILEFVITESGIRLDKFLSENSSLSRSAVASLIEDGKVTVNPRNIRYWSPDDPYLYRFTLKSGKDEIKSYFAIRTVETKTVNGIPKICCFG